MPGQHTEPVGATGRSPLRVCHRLPLDHGRRVREGRPRDSADRHVDREGPQIHQSTPRIPHRPDLGGGDGQD